MVTRKSDFRRLFREAFVTDTAWTDWFVEKVYADDEALWVDVDGKAVSTLLMTPYTIDYHGTGLPLAYISCVATAKAERGKGHMNTLMEQALGEARERGYAFAALIPATRHLYFLYDKYGFATVFYVDELRYTSLHAFTAAEGFAPAEPDYAMLSRLEGQRHGMVRHSAAQYGHVLTDIALDGGTVVAAAHPDGRAAMAFVTADEHEARVLDLLADDEAVAEAVMAQVRDFAGEKSLIVNAVPGERRAALRARGMMRIVNVDTVLGALSAAHPEVDQVIRVRDRHLAENNGVFRLRRGTCRRLTEDPDPRHIDLDTDIATLTSILFSAPATGEIFNLPTHRPFISLMLD